MQDKAKSILAPKKNIVWYFASKNLTLVMLNKLRCQAYLQFSADQITRSRLLIWINILNDKQSRSRSVGFWRSQLVWIYTVCKGRVYPGSAGQGLSSAYHNMGHVKWKVFRNIWKMHSYRSSFENLHSVTRTWLIHFKLSYGSGTAKALISVPYLT